MSFVIFRFVLKHFAFGVSQLLRVKRLTVWLQVLGVGNGGRFAYSGGMDGHGCQIDSRGWFVYTVGNEIGCWMCVHDCGRGARSRIVASTRNSDLCFSNNVIRVRGDGCVWILWFRGVWGFSIQVLVL